MRHRSLPCAILAFCILSGCTTEYDLQQERQAAQAAYVARCNAEIGALKEKITDRWERRIAQNEVIARCSPDRASIATVANAFLRMARKKVDAGVWTDEEAWLKYAFLTHDLQSRQDAEQQRQDDARLQAASQALMGLNLNGGLFKPAPMMPPPTSSPVPSVPMFQPQPVRPPVTCTSRMVGQQVQTNCY